MSMEKKLAANEREPNPGRFPESAQLASNSRPEFLLFPVLVAQLGLFADQRDLLTANEDMLYIRLHVEWISVRDHHVAHLAHIQRAKVLVHAPDLRRIDGEGL